MTKSTAAMKINDFSLSRNLARPRGQRIINFLGKLIPSVWLRVMFDSDTMGIAFGLGLSQDLEIGDENWILYRHSK